MGISIYAYFVILPGNILVDLLLVEWKMSKQQFFAGIIKDIPQITPTNKKNLSIKFCPVGDCYLTQNVRVVKKEENWL